MCINPGRPGLVPKGKRIGGDEGQHSARIKIIQYPVGLIFEKEMDKESKTPLNNKITIQGCMV